MCEIFFKYLIDKKICIFSLLKKKIDIERGKDAKKD